MTVSFNNGDLDLPNGQAAALLEVIGYPAPIVNTHGSMYVEDALKGVQRAKQHVDEGSELLSNVLELELILEALVDIGVETLNWS